MRFGIVVVVAAMLAGCSQPQIIMDRQNTTEAEWKKDDFACMQEAYAAGGGVLNQYGRYTREPNPGMYQKCMEARGYTRVR